MTLHRASVSIPAFVTLASVLAAQAPQAPPETKSTAAAAPQEAGEVSAFFKSLSDALFKGAFDLNIRLRAEIVEQTNLDTAQAYTERTRLGYTTNPFHGLSFHLDFEDIRTADYDLYNASGLNGQPGKAVVADPQVTELNQFLAQYTSDYVTGIAGRQRIILDDHRFVGNVGWRQNEQTFDAYTLKSQWIPNTTLFYSYVDDVNRIFGPDSRRDFQSDSHLIHASYNFKRLGKLTGFAYLLDFLNSPTNSSDTTGLRFTGKQELPKDFNVEYLASYAYQVDARPNPVDYAAHFYAFEGLVGRKGLGSAGAGYEVLASDGGTFAFQTPLATLHKFDGWADLFLTTPAAGIEDLYLLVNAQLPFGVKGTAVYHWFFSEDGSADFGQEFDARLEKSLSANVSVLAKLAVFDGDAGFPDVQKYWMDLELSF